VAFQNKPKFVLPSLSRLSNCLPANPLDQQGVPILGSTCGGGRVLMKLAPLAISAFLLAARWEF